MLRPDIRISSGTVLQYGVPGDLLNFRELLLPNGGGVPPLAIPAFSLGVAERGRDEAWRMEAIRVEMPPLSSLPAMWHVGCAEEAGAVRAQVNQHVGATPAGDRVA